MLKNLKNNLRAAFEVAVFMTIAKAQELSEKLKSRKDSRMYGRTHLPEYELRDAHNSANRNFEI